MIRRPAPFLVFMLFFVPACDLGGPGDPDPPVRTPLASPTGENSLVIGLVGTLSGDEAWRGEDALEGADLAVGLLNRNLEEDAKRFELLTLDDGGDVEEATALVEQVAGLEQAVGVIYAGPPEGLPGAEAALADSEIPALLTYGDLYGAQRLSPSVFQVSPSYVWEARRIASYFLNDRGYEKIGVLSEDSFSGETATDAMTQAIQLYNGVSPSIRTYPLDVEDFRELLVELEQENVEAIVVQGRPSAFARVISELKDMGSTYRTTDAARIDSLSKRVRRRLRKRNSDRTWRPHIAGFDIAISPAIGETIPPGTIASDTYARGAHYLPVPSLRDFAQAFQNWWDARPLGWELRGYMAVRAIGWAVEKEGEGGDLPRALETLGNERFGGLPITLGPDDHTFVGTTTVGLWVVPRSYAGIAAQERLPDELPWVPLSRGFSTDGELTDVLPGDWKHLFRNPPPPGAPAPPVGRLRFGVSTLKRDPVH